MDVHVTLDRLLSLGSRAGVPLALRQFTSGAPLMLPEGLSREIINELCSNYTFNTLSAGLLKKSVKLQ